MKVGIDIRDQILASHSRDKAKVIIDARKEWNMFDEVMVFCEDNFIYDIKDKETAEFIADYYKQPNILDCVGKWVLIIDFGEEVRSFILTSTDEYELTKWNGKDAVIK